MDDVPLCNLVTVLFYTPLGAKDPPPQLKDDTPPPLSVFCSVFFCLLTKPWDSRMLTAPQTFVYTPPQFQILINNPAYSGIPLSCCLHNCAQTDPPSNIPDTDSQPSVNQFSFSRPRSKAIYIPPQAFCHFGQAVWEICPARLEFKWLVNTYVHIQSHHLQTSGDRMSHVIALSNFFVLVASTLYNNCY